MFVRQTIKGLLTYLLIPASDDPGGSEKSGGRC